MLISRDRLQQVTVTTFRFIAATGKEAMKSKAAAKANLAQPDKMNFLERNVNVFGRQIMIILNVCDLYYRGSLHFITPIFGKVQAIPLSHPVLYKISAIR